MDLLPILRRSFVALIFAACASNAAADVAVLANRATREITVQLMEVGKRDRTLAIPAGATRPVFFDGGMRVRFGPLLAPQTYELAHGAAYFFAYESDGQTMRMERIGLGASDLEQPTGQPQGDSRPPVAKVGDQPISISVKLAVDEDEPTHRSIWEPRLRERVQKASEFLEQHCGVRLSIDSVVTWESDDKLRDFALSMREFESEVKPHPAQLVIGFSSQYDFSVGRIHLGGSRGPLYPYILLKERAPNVREPEKLELLIHELCHYLGAAHSPEPTSVMRPVLQVSQLRLNGGRVYLDPVNALLMSLVGHELRQGNSRNFADIPLSTQQRMLEIYQVLGEALPQDPAARQFQTLVGRRTRTAVDQLPVHVREIMKQLTQFAKLQKARAEKAGIEMAGDALTVSYVREAALIASDIQSPDAARAMLLSLGLFLDDTQMLRAFPATGALAAQIETEEQRANRIAIIGQPTMQGRADFTKHFFVSAHLTVGMGSSAARSVGLAKEVLDSHGGSGFSFADMVANRAGIIFAEHVLDGAISLEQLATSFSIDKYMPDVSGLAEGLQSDDFRQNISDGGKALLAGLDECEQRIRSLPVYQTAAAKKPSP